MQARLQNFHPAQFMRKHWQRKPLFLKAALSANFLALMRADLFRLAARHEVESRLIARKKIRGQWRYTAADGPFRSDDLAAYKNRRDWTLLVQRVNEWLPRVDLLFEYFSFIANWRIDDIMVSYAAPGGTVGAHLDNYDVFLCQLHGRRTWQYSAHPSKAENLEPGQPVRLLTDFKSDHEIVAGPGDVLYIPPRFGHYGVADTECITVSVGFRAPQVGQLMGILFDEVAAVSGGGFYGDKGVPPARQPGAIDERALTSLLKLAQSGFVSGSRSLSTAKLSDTLLRHLSVTPNSQVRTRARLSRARFKARWKKQILQRNPRNQYFYRASRGSLTLYAAGESFVLPGKFRTAVAEFCNRRLFAATRSRLESRAQEFWYEMYVLGFVFFPG